MKKQTLTLMIGLPRCGKTTWIKKNKGDAVVVSPDDIRAKIYGHEFHKEAEDYIWAFAKAMTRLLLDQGKSVIIDATNINNYSRDIWIRLAREYKVKIRMVWIKTPLKECIKRNKKANTKVPEDIILRFATHFENPSYGVLDKDIEIIEIPKAKKVDSFGNYYWPEVNEILLKKRNGNGNN